MAVIQELRSHGWRTLGRRLEQRPRATQGAVAEVRSFQYIEYKRLFFFVYFVPSW
jgi:hypothetical protein